MTASTLRHHTVRVPATTANLGPGFDAFGAALTRYLSVGSRPRHSQAERVLTAGDDELPTDERNLVWRSLVSFCEAYDVPVPDVALRVVNDVPLERGLGSSSAAIVAGLTLARALSGVEVGDLALVELAATLEGHPDNVAPALLGGLAACGRCDDGTLVVRRVNPAPDLRPVALVPTARQPTSAARAVLPDALSRADVVAQAARAGHVLAGLVGVWPVDPRLVGDRLHEPARLQAMGPSGALVEELRAGGQHAWLSGAGPAVLVLGRGAAPPLADLAAIGSRHGFEPWPLRFDLAGALACPDGGCAFAPSGPCVQCPGQRVA